MRRTFDYLPHASQPCVIGARVRVPFGRRMMVGIVVATSDDSSWPTEQLKAVADVIDDEPLWPSMLLDVLKWASRYYQHPLGEVLHHALNKKLRQGDAPTSADIEVWQLTDLGRQQTVETTKRAPKQWLLLCLLQDGAQERASLTSQGANGTTITAVHKKNWIELAPLSALQDTNVAASQQPPATVEQSVAITALNSNLGRFSVSLLEGITGSGKTRVYLDVMAEVVAKGEQVLVLVPEIGLTPQTLSRFRQHLGVRIGLIHSGLNDSERLAAWQAARQGEISVLLGTRSALFTPMKNLGLIVVDEEHDGSYKQQDGFRYHARDLAVMRARAEQVPLLLGSATPSFESLANAKAGRYHHLRLTQRAAGGKLPKIAAIDMRQQVMAGPLSAPILNAMSEHLKANNQVLVFLNRRGFSPVLLCHECGWFAECQRCNRPYTWHKQFRRLHCHHCQTERPVPSQCDSCGSTQLVPVGQGTEQLEEALQAHFVDYPVVRIDRDSTRRKDAFDQLVNDVQRGHYRILVGTQMLAKGHDFADVTLVVIADVDGALFSSDFRAAERMCQLLTQVSGRAGRAGQDAQVLLQTHYPEHPWVQQLQTQPYDEVADGLLSERKQAQLPPYAALAMIRAEANDENKVVQFLNEVEAELRKVPVDKTVTIMAPSPCAMVRKAGRYRWQLAVLAAQKNAIQQLLSQALPAIEGLRSAQVVRWHVDVDPQETV
ncbi:primosomal protein N' [Neiella marina]|uniref:Replication restart protein PriA n=2 Tax=Neiella holothuriorum TaxID=2870530 RepID=A0ABS7EDN4_9GAMM|nr:primosomal protein N' [Neiella holothuriorum]